MDGDAPGRAVKHERMYDRIAYGSSVRRDRLHLDPIPNELHRLLHRAGKLGVPVDIVVSRCRDRLVHDEVAGFFRSGRCPLLGNDSAFLRGEECDGRRDASKLVDRGYAMPPQQPDGHPTVVLACQLLGRIEWRDQNQAANRPRARARCTTTPEPMLKP